MQSKVSVILVKSKAINNSSDINKMAVHLEQILLEKEKTDVKTRLSITEPVIKSTDFIVFCGYDSALLSEFFKALAVIEGIEGDGGPTIFLYEEPGQTIWEHLNYILRDGAGLRRISPKVFNKVIDTWSYRDIIGTIDMGIKKLGTRAPDRVEPALEPGHPTNIVSPRPVEA
jgi:hypothetical protein